MNVTVLGATGRLGRMARHYWSGKATWLGRALDGIPKSTECLIDLRGIVPGRGDLSQNEILTRKALDTAQALGIQRVFVASTAAVYGQHPGPLTAEVAAPISDYGQAKHAMELMAAAHPQTCTVLRIGNVAGADAILGAWQPGFILDQFPDGRTPSRSYIGPATLARILQGLSQLPDLPAVLNIAAPGAIAFGDLLDAAGYSWTPRRASADTIANVTLDTQPLETLMSFAPEEQTPHGIATQWLQMKDAT